MPYDLTNLLVVAISSSALFDTRGSHDVFVRSGPEAYIQFQLERENVPFARGSAFPLVASLLNLNALSPTRLIEVVVLSQNVPEVGLRVMNSIEHYGIDITRAAFTGGEPVARYLKPYNVSLFLSRNEDDVRDAIALKIAAGMLYDPPDETDIPTDQLRIAFDGDAVLFSGESEQIYQTQGIEAFTEHEVLHAQSPMLDGPFAAFLRIIAKLQNDVSILSQTGIVPIRTALVTARDSPSHKRVLLTLRAWNVTIDEIFFLGGVSKDQILKGFRPHIFFDDQEAHTKPASRHVPSARVLQGSPIAPRVSTTQRAFDFDGVMDREGVSAEDEDGLGTIG